MNESYSKNPIFILSLAAIAIASNAISARADSGEAILVSASDAAESTSNPVPFQLARIQTHAEENFWSGATHSAVAIRPQTQLPQVVVPTAIDLPANRVAPAQSPTTPSEIDRQLLNAAATFSEGNSARAAAAAPRPVLLAQTQPTSIPQTTASQAELQAESAIPAPGTVATSVEALLLPSNVTPQAPALTNTVQLPVAQRRTSDSPRFRLNEPYSYVGIGGNIGITDNGSDNNNTTNNNEQETPLGEGSFVINGKIGLGPSLSVRPAILVNDDVAFLIPVTYDFRIPTRDPLEVSPFIPFAGAGVVVTTTENNHIGFLLSGGVDYRISPQWTANGSLNVGFLSDTTDIGVILGIGYTFPGFSF